MINLNGWEFLGIRRPPKLRNVYLTKGFIIGVGNIKRKHTIEVYSLYDMLLERTTIFKNNQLLWKMTDSKCNYIMWLEAKFLLEKKEPSIGEIFINELFSKNFIEV